MLTVAALASTLLSGPVFAGSEGSMTLCVGDDLAPPGRCGACDDTFASFAEAAAEALAQQASAVDTLAVRLCLLDLAFGQDAHVESLVLDNTGDVYGNLNLDLGGRSYCPDADAPTGAPVIDLVAGSFDMVSGLNIDVSASSVCPATASGLVSGGVGLTVIEPTLNGTSGVGIEWGVTHPAGGNLVVEGGSIVNALGAALEATNSVLLARVQVSGCRVDGASGGAAVVAGLGGASQLIFRDSVFSSNLAVGAGRGVVTGPIVIVDNSAFLGNGMAEGAALVVTSPLPVFLEQGGEPQEGRVFGIFDSVFAGNRVLGSIGEFELPPLAAALFADDSGQRSCASIPEGTPFESRSDAFASLPGGDGPLLRASDLGSGEDMFWLRKSFLVENETGSSPLIVLDGTPNDTLIELTHNTVAGNLSGSVLSVTSDGSARVSILRNLVVGAGPGAAPLVDVVGGLGGAFASMNAVLGEARTWFSADLEAEFSLFGPDLIVSDPEFRALDDVQALDSCGRHTMVCGDDSVDDCEAAEGEGLARLTCAAGAAGAWLPTPEFAGELTVAWPWKGSYFVDGAQVPGATGGSCGFRRGTLDEASLGAGGSWGDHDGYPDAFDCDNLDADVVPSLPEEDGFATETCAPSGHDCYLCPKGSVVVGDDDDSAILPDDDDDSTDDDDSGLADDDDDTEGPPDGLDGEMTGCGVGGCGFAWSCESGGSIAWLGLLIPLSRRRVPRRAV